MIASAVALAGLVSFASAQGVATTYPGVLPSGTMGPTNPPKATEGTPINQESEARLVSLNSVDDFCLFGPKEPGHTIGDTEAEQVAWCTQPRNNARVIPDGTITAAHFVKTPFYVQIQGFGDFTKIGITEGDYGGELDPHGATNKGNPIGGNVTSNVSGEDVSYQEWMEFISYEQFCLRICTAANETWNTGVMCEHKLDIMGCQFVMPGDYTPDTFDSCEGEPAYPPGVYPIEGGGYSTFAQRFTGTYTADGTAVVYTVGQTVTPTAPYMVPATSNCVKATSIKANGLDLPGAAASTGAAGLSSPGAKDSVKASSGTKSSSQTGTTEPTSGTLSFGAPALGLAATAGVVVLSAFAVLL